MSSNKCGFSFSDGGWKCHLETNHVGPHSPELSSVVYPSHYGGADNPYEAIKVIEAWDLGFNLGNCVKYLSRAGKKDPAKLVEDLRKAAWYLNREIEKATPPMTRTSLTDDELRIALANVGVDITCGACAELFYTGHYNAKHTCHPTFHRAVIANLRAALSRIVATIPIAPLPDVVDGTYVDLAVAANLAHLRMVAMQAWHEAHAEYVGVTQPETMEKFDRWWGSRG